MKEFKINKFTEREVTMFGMKLLPLGTFVGVIVLDAILVCSFFNWIVLLIGIIALLPLRRVVINAYKNDLLGKIFNESHPDQITNDI